MGKKKQKSRQKDPSNDSSSGEENNECAVTSKCKHVARSVNIGSVRKTLLKSCPPIGKCLACSNDAEKKPADVPAAAQADCNVVVEPPSVYMCLHCGFQGCDRSSEHKHALEHFNTQRSSPHEMAVCIGSWQVWCYTCDDFVDLPSSKKLQECVNFVQRQASVISHNNDPTGSKASDNQKQHRGGRHAGVKEEVKEDAASTSKAVKSESVVNSKPAAATAVDALFKCSKVKGLANLGNTCFFNAVMQNLSQTHLLEVQLREHAVKGKTASLLSCPVEAGDSSEANDSRSDSGVSSCKNEDMDAVTVNLGEVGSLTDSLLRFIEEMNSKETSKQNCVRPSELFGQICQKAPRFKGFQQQDSHELLHYLFDGIKTEESKRSRGGILKAFNLPENVKPKDVPEEEKLKIKAYSSHTKHTFIDCVFGGYFINTVVCAACNTHHQIFESFLDISLPISDEKTAKLMHNANDNKAGSNKKNSVESDSNIDIPAQAAKLSKNMTKKQQKAQRKQGRRKQTKKPSVSETKEDGGEVEKGSVVDEVPEKSERSDDDDVKKNDDDDDKENQALSESDDEEKSKDVTQNGAAGKCLDQSREDSAHDADTEDACDNSEDKSLRDPCVKGDDQQAVAPDNDNSSRCPMSASNVDVVSDTSSLDKHSKESTNVCSSMLTSEAVDDITRKVSDIDLHRVKAKADDSCVSNDTANATTPASNANKLVDNDSMNSMLENEALENDLLDTSSDSTVVSDDESRPSLSRKRAQHTSAHVKEEDESHVMARRVATESLAPRISVASDGRSLEACLAQFTMKEMLTGNNQFICSNCNSGRKGGESIKTCCSKQMLVYSPPAVLTLHLKRFQQIGYNLRKDSRHVSFPESLDLAPYCSKLCQNVTAGQKQILYSVYGVVVHEGTMRGGHYTAYVKVRQPNPDTRQFLQTLFTGQLTLERQIDTLHTLADHQMSNKTGDCDQRKETAAAAAAGPGKWFNISDSNVREVNSSNVFNSEAYLLFYERIY